MDDPPFNLDAHNQPSDLDADITILKELLFYAVTKQRAMACRLRGDMLLAIKHESDCEASYNKLPDKFQW